jgi:hypothetical protein
MKYTFFVLFVLFTACASPKNDRITGKATNRAELISGRFVTTAVQNRDVAFRRVDPADAVKTRYISTYREGLMLPDVGTTVERWGRSSFILQSISKASDGVVTKYVIDPLAGISSPDVLPKSNPTQNAGLSPINPTGSGLNSF